MPVTTKAKVAERFVVAGSREEAAAVWEVELRAVDQQPLTPQERQAIGGEPGRTIG